MENETFGKRKIYYFFMGVVAAVIFSALGYSFYSSGMMVNKYDPLIDATMEIRLEVTTAHLWFEERISGDPYESFDAIINHVKQAQWYARAMLEGGQNDEGTFLALTHPVLRKEIKICLELLGQFEKITHIRYSALGTSGIGSQIDQKYDALYRRLVEQVDHVETLLQEKVRSEYGRYKSIQIFLIVLAAMLSVLLVLIQYRHDRQLKENMIELNEARSRAEENWNWLTTTMNSMGDGVIITDHVGKVTYLNPVASSLTGWLLKDAKDKDITDIFKIVNEYTKEPVQDPVNIVIRKNVVVGLANHTELISKDGRVWPISDSAAPIFDHDNHLRGVVIVFHEITAQKKAEAEKKKLEAQLRQAYKMEAIGTMAGGIAHDFNNILAMIIGNADIAFDDIPETHRARHNISQIIKAGARAKDLVKQILSFSRQSTDSRKPHSLSRLVLESMKSLKSTIPASVKQEVHIDVDDTEDTIIADSTQIHQLLLNLCVNAVQAMDEKGTLTVGLEKVILQDRKLTDHVLVNPGTYVHLSVSDTGCGIVSENMEKIFDPFFTTKQIGQGTGMGLSVVHGVVENHEGKIGVQSEPGKGTTFHIYFPVTRQTVQAEPGDDETLPAGTGRILLVDDEEMLVEVGRDILEKQGYQVTATTDATEALALYQKNPSGYDLVITDQTMPDIIGSELAEKLLKINPDLPIILCTGFSSKIDRKRAEQIGIREFASKPFDRMALLKLVRKVLA